MDIWMLDKERDLHLREVQREDVEAASNVARRAFQSERCGEQVHQMLTCALTLTSGNYPGGPVPSMLSVTYYVLVRHSLTGEAVCGLTGLYTRLWDEAERGNYWLGWFAVDPDFQRQGLGELLLSATAALCAGRGGKRLNIETTTEAMPARCLYRRLGFTEVPAIPDYWDVGSDLLLCYKNLATDDKQAAEMLKDCPHEFRT